MEYERSITQGWRSMLSGYKGKMIQQQKGGAPGSAALF